VISAADVAAVAATNCRRESFFRDMAFPPWWANRKCLKSRSCSASQAGLGPRGDLVDGDQSRIDGFCRET
jgi:hypothetical protein